VTIHRPCGRAGLLRAAVAASLALAGAQAALHAQAASKLDAALRGTSAASVRVIVSTRPGKADQVADGLIQHGRSHVRTHAIIEAVSAEVPVEDLATLDADPAVTDVSLDATISSEARGGGGKPADAEGATLQAILGLPAGGLTGKGVGVAVVDSGVDHSGDFSNVSEYDFTESGAGGDAYGHGTHLAGLIASKGTQSQGAYAGLAPKARLISLKVLDAQGQGLTSAVIDALEFATVNKSALGIDIINLSLGHPIYEPAGTDPLVQAVEAAVRAGIVVVASAGNVGRNPATGDPGYAGILSPGNAPSAITVGAVDARSTTTRTDDAIPSYSSRGPTWYDALPKPDLVAPGQDLVSDASIGSALYLQYPDRRVAGNGGQLDFLRLSGTSLSAAVTSGVAALLIEAGRDASGVGPTPALIKAILEYTALPVAGADPLTQGHGALNASGAVSLLQALGDAAVPEAVASAPITPVTTIDGETDVWSQSFGWSDTVVWGNSTPDAAPAWLQAIVWGNIGWSDTVVWGNADTMVWGNLLAWGDTVVWGNTNGVD
jgi:serine protease AprX